MKVPLSCSACTNPFCTKLTTESRASIFQAKKWVNYSCKNEQSFFLENQQVLILEQGVIMPIRVSSTSKQRGLDLLTAGDLLGIVGVFQSEDERDFFQILPLTDCAGCMVSANFMRHMVLECPDVGRAFCAQITRRFSRMVDNLCTSTLEDSETQVELARRKLEGLGVDKYSHRDLAMLTGMNRVTVTRILNKR